MEEQKIESKEIKMKPVKTEANASEGPKKLSYDKLNQACMDLSNQNQQMQKYIQKLHQQMQEMSNLLQTRRMDYLFKVVEVYMKSEKFFDADFVLKCAEEIQESLIIPEEQEDSKEN